MGNSTQGNKTIPQMTPISALSVGMLVHAWDPTQPVGSRDSALPVSLFPLSTIAQAANTALMGPVSGSPAVPAFRAIALQDLPNINVSGGGTGRTSFTANGVLIGEGTSGLNATAAGSTGSLLAGNTGADPTFQTVSALGIAKSGANSDITSLSALTTPISGTLLKITVLTSSGTFTSLSTTKRVRVKQCGGGNNGGQAGATGSGQYSAGSGGQRGAYAEADITSGFSGGITATIGGVGGTTSFGSLVVTPGGALGVASSPITNTGTAFILSSGTQSAPSFTGAGTTALCSLSTQGGERALFCGGTNNLTSGVGGSGPWGTGGASVSGSGVGNAGTGFGSGGSGGTQGAASSGAQAGGAGTPGQMIIEEWG